MGLVNAFSYSVHVPIVSHGLMRLSLFPLAFYPRIRTLFIDEFFLLSYLSSHLGYETKSFDLVPCLGLRREGMIRAQM